MNTYEILKSKGIEEMTYFEITIRQNDFMWLYKLLHSRQIARGRIEISMDCDNWGNTWDPTVKCKLVNIKHFSKLVDEYLESINKEFDEVFFIL